MFPSRKRLAAASALLLLAGCAAGVATITHDDLAPFYSPQVVNYTAQNGEFPTAIYGNPFGSGADRALLEGMRIPGDFTPAVLKPIAKGEPRTDGHFVFIFDAELAPGGRAACKAPEKVKLGTSRAQIQLQGAFCYGDEMASEALLTTARPSRPDDPRFRAEMDQFLAILLKPYDDQHSDCQPC